MMAVASPTKQKAASFVPVGDQENDKTKRKKKQKQGGGAESAGEFVPYARSRGIVYFSHLPHGMYERELRDFLSQFGSVTNLRLGRSRKTGASRGFAFVEFRHAEVAAIVCDTMNNYLMFDKLVKCQLVPEDRASRACFRNKVDPAKPPGKKARTEAKRQVNQLRTEEQNNKRLRKQLAKLEALKKKLEDAGVSAEVAPGAASAPTSTGKTPVMEVDEDDLDIKLKTPPNVRKVKSRGNSAASSAAASLAATPTSTQSAKKKKRAVGLQQELLAAQLAKKLGHKEEKGADKKKRMSLDPRTTSKKSPPSGKKQRRRSGKV